jgi:hypothetical protein
MVMISFESKGSFNKTENFFNNLKKINVMDVLKKNGEKGVDALEKATPKDTKETAFSWYYEIEKTKDYYQIFWSNKNIEDGIPVVILLQYGHGTGTGGYVAGEDFINPAIKPIFDKITDDIWKAVKRA